jgi:hypothetical protein
VTVIRKLVSGGQTGVDRAALDYAIEIGLPYGGWVPRGGRAEDYPNPPGLLAIYPELREHESRDWAPRTKANIQHANATLVVIDSRYPTGPGTKLTINKAKELGKPCLQLDVADPIPFGPVSTFFTQFSEPIALNVAGSRGSSIPTIYDDTKQLLCDLFATFMLDVRPPVIEKENS